MHSTTHGTSQGLYPHTEAFRVLLHKLHEVIVGWEVGVAEIELHLHPTTQPSVYHQTQTPPSAPPPDRPNQTKPLLSAHPA
jgi:hypothetical protein